MAVLASTPKAPRPLTPTRVALERFSENPAAMLGLLFLGILVVLALLANVFSPYNPDAESGETFQPPSAEHWMGTDNVARDVFSRFLRGVRVSLMVGLVAATLSSLAGIVIGAVAGYVGGTVEALLMRAADIVLTIPMLVLGLALAVILGGSIVNIILIIAFLSWPTSARLVRSEFLSLREREFVQAAVAVGSSTGWIVFSEILPNAAPAILVNWSYEVGRAIILEAGLSFLGLGDVTAGSWGIMLQDAQRFLAQAWWLSVFPGLGIAVSVLSANLVGEGLNDALNPKSQTR